MSVNICIFGDSITEGYYDNEGGWVKRLSSKLSSHQICNLGISGDTTEDLLKRFDVNVADKNPKMIIFSIGVNDSILILKENRNFVDFEKFKENIRQLIEKARKITKNIVFVGLLSVDESKVTPMPWEPELHYLNKDVEKYDQAIKEICETENLRFIDVNGKMKQEDYLEWLDDGVHPNSKGHEWLANLVVKQLTL